MALDRLLFGALLISLAACTAAPQPPVAPTVMSFPGLPPLTSPTPAAPASLEFVACMEKARVAAMVAARPGEPYPVADGCVNLVVENAFSANFIVTRVIVVLDDSRIFDRTESAATRGPLATTPVFRVFLGPVAAGKHTIKLLVNMRGDGTGPTAFFQGYRFEVRSSHAFTLGPTDGIEVRSIFYEKQPLSTHLEERPAIRYVDTTRQPTTAPDVTSPPPSPPKLP
jgi:hypothetical protein